MRETGRALLRALRHCPRPATPRTYHVLFGEAASPVHPLPLAMDCLEIQLSTGRTVVADGVAHVNHERRQFSLVAACGPEDAAEFLESRLVTLATGLCEEASERLSRVYVRRSVGFGEGDEAGHGDFEADPVVRVLASFGVAARRIDHYTRVPFVRQRASATATVKVSVAPEASSTSETTHATTSSTTPAVPFKRSVSSARSVRVGMFDVPIEEGQEGSSPESSTCACFPSARYARSQSAAFSKAAPKLPPAQL